TGKSTPTRICGSARLETIALVRAREGGAREYSVELGANALGVHGVAYISIRTRCRCSGSRAREVPACPPTRRSAASQTVAARQRTFGRGGRRRPCAMRPGEARADASG